MDQYRSTGQGLNKTDALKWLLQWSFLEASAPAALSRLLSLSSAPWTAALLSRRNFASFLPRSFLRKQQTFLFFSCFALNRECFSLFPAAVPAVLTSTLLKARRCKFRLFVRISLPVCGNQSVTLPLEVLYVCVSVCRDRLCNSSLAHVHLVHGSLFDCGKHPVVLCHRHPLWTLLREGCHRCLPPPFFTPLSYHSFLFTISSCSFNFQLIILSFFLF